MKVKLKNVLPNPFRDMDRYPIHPQKIEQLKRSIESTTFWDNIVARKAGKTQIEIAYGHHRLVALRELYDGEKEFDFIVRDLDDKEMLKIMAHENLDEWGHDSAIERETVRAVVKAFAEDRIALPKPSKDTPSNTLRYAPSFCFGINAVSRRSSGSDEGRPYTADTIVGFLGGTMSINTVKYTLRALCLMEEGHIKESQLKGLSSAQAREIVDETAKAIKQAEVIRKDAEREALRAPTPVVEKQIKREAEKKAKAIVNRTAATVSTALQQGRSAQEAKEQARAMRAEIRSDERELPEINEAASRVSGQILRLLDPDYEPAKKLQELIKFKAHLSPMSIKSLDTALARCIEYAEGYRARLSK